MINGNNDYLVKSVDACSSLSTLIVPVSSGYFNILHRVDTINIYFMSLLQWPSCIVHKSVDGGETWTKKMDDASQAVNQIAFFDSLEGVVMGNYKLIRTKKRVAIHG